MAVTGIAQRIATSAVNESAAAGSPPLASPRYQPLVTVAVAVAAGIVLDRYCSASLGARLTPLGQLFWPTADSRQPITFIAWWMLAALSLVAWWLAWRRGRDAVALWLVLGAAVLSAAGWHHARWHLFDRVEVMRYAGYEPAPACVLAVARETPERMPAPPATPLRAIPGSERSRLTIELTAIRDGRRWQPAAGICQLSVEGHLLAVHAGDRLQAFGQLSRLRPPLNPGEFNFAAHARADRQLARLRSSAPECITVLARGRQWRPARVLEAIRAAGKGLVRRHVGPDHAGLAAAVLLGARESLTAEETLPYLLTGTIHVLVVSGLNVAVLATGLFALMRLGVLSRRKGLAIVMAIVVLYALVAESQPPVVRAAVLALLMCVAAWIGRRGAAFNLLAAAALIVLALNPGDLFRTGPQLSFLAVATLIWIGPWSFARGRAPADRLDQLLAALRPWYIRAAAWLLRWIGWLLVTSLAVWLVTLPLLLNRFHVGSPVAVAISPAIWLVVFVAMWSGFSMLAIGWLGPPLAGLCGSLCAASLAGLDRLVEWAEALPAGHFWLPGPAWWWVLGFYLALLLVTVPGRAIAPPRWQLAALCGWIIGGFVPTLAREAGRDGLECSFVAVGHGACVVLESPTGETLLYDAGALGAPEYATQTIASYLWHRGIRRIDGIIISHADIDHYNAVPGLLERFAVGGVYVSPLMFDGVGRSDDGPKALQEAIQTAGVPIRRIWSGDRLHVGRDLTLWVLHPPRRGVLGSDNANSVTLVVESAGRRLLLPGDLESPGLEDVMAELPCDCDVLLAPHHGSRRSDPPGFAAWSTPEWVVISGGGGDEVRPVVRTYQEAGADVARTSDCGTIQFSVRAGELKMTTWLTPRPERAPASAWR
jgi:competence protein ComEC